MLPIQQVSSPIAAVAMPALSRLQNQPQEYKKMFRNALALSCLTSFPFIAWMIISRQDIILIAFGPQWVAAIPIFAALAVSAFFQPVGNLSSLLYITLGRTKQMLIWSVVGNIWIVTGIVFGLPYGAVGVAIGYSFATALMMLPLMLFSISGTFVDLFDYLEPLKIPSVAAVASGLIGWIINNLMLSDHYSPFLRVSFVGLSIALIYFAVAIKLRPQLFFLVKNLLLKST
jgi:PST family polysaccharide transporter